jgi:hypothetical protein
MFKLCVKDENSTSITANIEICLELDNAPFVSMWKTVRTVVIFASLNSTIIFTRGIQNAQVHY